MREQGGKVEPMGLRAKVETGTLRRRQIFLAYAELVTGRPEVDSHNRMELTEDERLTGKGRGMAE